MPTAAHKDKRLHFSQVLLIYIAPTLDANVISCHSSRSRVQFDLLQPGIPPSASTWLQGGGLYKCPTHVCQEWMFLVDSQGEGRFSHSLNTQ